MFENHDITLLAVDSKSFIEHKESFKISIKILPMIHTVWPFKNIRMLYSATLYYSKKYLPSIGILYLILQLFLLSIIRKFSRRVKEITSEIDQACLIIAVGGNYLWSNEGFYNQIIPLFYAKFLKKKKVILLGHSIGPFKQGIDTWTARLLFEKIDAIMFREEISYDYVNKNILPLKNGIISSDFAFLLEHKRSKEKMNKQIVGFTIRKWLNESPELFQRYLSSIIALIEMLSEKGYIIYLIPFSYLPGQENDVEICNLVLEMINTPHRNNVYKIDMKDMSPIQIMENLNELDISILVGTRLHSVILASIAGISPIIISYQHFKALGISKQLGIDNLLLKIDEMNFKVLKDKFLYLSENIESVNDKMLKSLIKIRERLYSNMRAILSQIMSRQEQVIDYDK
jgi:colanic acid/amylovoran biosynthesis protein